MKRHNHGAKAIKKVADTMAKMGYGAASVWSIYQPKEPKKPSSKK